MIPVVKVVVSAHPCAIFPGEFTMANSGHQMRDPVSRLRRNLREEGEGTCTYHLSQEQFHAECHLTQQNKNSRKVSLPECERFGTCSSLSLSLCEILNLHTAYDNVSGSVKHLFRGINRQPQLRCNVPTVTNSIQPIIRNDTPPTK
ncbi:hypothetical protein Mapa_012843 [Marchantia paleacea]|nr:hypothetical protein Mapa_012843 [Marchantia paleacea]